MESRTTVASAVAAALRSRAVAGIMVAGALGWHPLAAEAQNITFSPASEQVVHPATSVTFTVTDSDTNFAGDVTQSWMLTSPQHGEVTPDGDCPLESPGDGLSTFSCTYTYTPAPSYTGPDAFTLTVTDSASATGQLTVTLNTYPSIPTASNASVSTASGSPVSVNLAASGDITYDPTIPASQVVVSIATPPAHGTATVSGTTITYTPSSAFAGTDTLAYQVSDGSIQNATATLSVGVAQPIIGIPSDLVGKTEAVGSSELTAAGFTVATTSEVSASYPPGEIITTQPAPGSSAARGSLVRIIVSQGPGPASDTPISSAPGLTPEQASTARGVEQTCAAMASDSESGGHMTDEQQDLLEKCSAIISDYSSSENVADLQQAMGAISGRQMTATARIPMQFAAGQLANISDRLSALRGGASGFSLSGLDPGLPGGAQSALGPLLAFARSVLGLRALGGGAGDDSGGLLGNRLGVFVNGTLRRGDQTETEAESGFDFTNNGVTAGVDYRLGTSYVLGLAGGYGKSETQFTTDGGYLDAKHTTISLYGTYFTDHFHLDWTAGFGHNSYDLDRSIDYDSSSTSDGCDGSSCSMQASGSTGGHLYSLSLGGGGDFHVEAFEFGPSLEVDYKQVGIDGFTESGASGLDLTYGGMTANSLLTELGAYLSYAWKTPWAVVIPQVRARYMHEFMNDARTETVWFAADTLPGASGRGFLLYTDAPDRDYFDWHASVLLQFPFGITGFVDYSQVSGLEYQHMHELDFGIRLEPGAL